MVLRLNRSKSRFSPVFFLSLTDSWSVFFSALVDRRTAGRAAARDTPRMW